MRLKFDIKPIPKQSARFGKKNIYQSAKVSSTQRAIGIMAKAQLPPGFTPYDCGLRVHVSYFFEYPKNLPQKKRKEHYKTTKPDITDNLNKLLFDALEGIVYVNDSRICSFGAEKFWSEKDGIELFLEPI